MTNLDLYAKEVFSVFRKLDFAPITYVKAPAHIDIIGFLPTKGPFEIKSKIIIRVSTKVSAGSIKSFDETIKNLFVKQGVIFTDSLTTANKSLSKKLNIEIRDKKSLKKLAKEYDVMLNEGLNKDFQLLSKNLSPVYLAGFIEDFAKGKIPRKLQQLIKMKNVKAWELLEDSVYSIFRVIFNFTTEQLGHKKLFENEPDGLTICNNETAPFGIIYDCKSSKSDYKMDANDKRAYIDYIESKKIECKHKYFCDLKYFIVVAPSFIGDIKKRYEEICSKTNVIPVFLSAKNLSFLALKVNEYQPNNRKLFQLTRIFKAENTIPQKAIIDEDNRVNELIRRSK